MLVVCFPSLALNNMIGPLYPHRQPCWKPLLSSSLTPASLAMTHRVMTDKSQLDRFVYRTIVFYLTKMNEFHVQGAWPIWKSVWITGQLEYLVLFDSCLYLVSSMNLNLSLKAIKVLLHSSVRDEIAVFLLDCVLYRSGKTDPTKEKLKKMVKRNFVSFPTRLLLYVFTVQIGSALENYSFMK